MSTSVVDADTSTALVPTEAHVRDLALSRAPEVVLDEARKAAAALKKVIDSKARPVKFNGETYLEFEDWQTVGRFYGVTAKVVSTTLLDLGDVRGFEARAVAVQVGTGQEISAADAMCLNDEPNWQKKPLFQIRSMAQTRACAKALRNVLAWVVVLAGYRPTPAEEVVQRGERMLSRSERETLFHEAKDAGWPDKDSVKAFLREHYGIEDTSQIPQSRFPEILEEIRLGPSDETDEGEAIDAEPADPDDIDYSGGGR